MRLKGLHEFFLAPVVLVPPQLAVLEVVEIDGGVAGLDQCPDSPVLVRHQGEEVALRNCSAHLLLALQIARPPVPSGATQQEAILSGATHRNEPFTPRRALGAQGTH